MILGKIWKAISAQFNKLANAIRGYDPIAEMQFEYDRSVEQIREGREGLAQYRAMVERVQRQVDGEQKQIAVLEARIKAYLTAGQRDMAGRLALDLQRAKAEMAQLANKFHFDVTTDFGQAEQVIQDQIDRNRARVRVAADMSGQGLEQVQQDIAVEKAMAEDALRQFEKEAGLVTPETAKTAESSKELGPATRTLEPVPEI